MKSEETRGRKKGRMEEGLMVFLLVVVVMAGVSGKEQCTTAQHRQMQVMYYMQVVPQTNI